VMFPPGFAELDEDEPERAVRVGEVLARSFDSAGAGAPATLRMSGQGGGGA